MDETSLIALLREFQPFCELGEDDLLILASRSSLVHLRKGSVLFRHGDNDHWFYCLVRGTVSLEASDGRDHRIDAGTGRAAQPLSRLRPRQYSARAVTAVEVLRIDGEGLGDVAADPTQDEYLVEEMLSEDDARSEAAAIYATELGDRALELPSLPSVAVETARLIDRDEADVPSVARIVMLDPAISAKLVRAANSPLFYGRSQIQTCERAIGRLGLVTTRRLVLAFAMRDLFEAKGPALAGRMEALWLHSTEIAALTGLLAHRLGGFDPDEAQLAGLLHDIGAVPVLRYAAGREALAEAPETLDHLLEDLKAEIGARLLRAWNFPDALVTAVVDAENWWRDDDEAPDLADLVIVAQILSRLGKPGLADVPPLVRLPAFAKVTGGRLDAAGTLALVDEAHEQIAQVQAILR